MCATTLSIEQFLTRESERDAEAAPVRVNCRHCGRFFYAEEGSCTEVFRVCRAPLCQRKETGRLDPYGWWGSNADAREIA